MTMPQVIAMGIANALPGCEAQNFATEGTTVLKGRVMGWGPSLHRIGMAWAVTPASMTSEDVGAALEPYLAVQRRRIETARALGLATDRQPEPGDLSHLLTDALLLGWDKDLRNAVPRQLARLKQMSRPGRERIVGMGDMTIAEAGALSGTTTSIHAPACSTGTRPNGASSTAAPSSSTAGSRTRCCRRSPACGWVTCWTSATASRAWSASRTGLSPGPTCTRAPFSSTRVPNGRRSPRHPRETENEPHPRSRP